ncbi:MAG: hypothetical protein IT429_22270 [Gemmataceae bacterium]|nr:hypothetical protein [Gemmataceae bacterium]
MPEFLKTCYDTEGPFGIPMRDHQARALDAVVRGLPHEEPYEPRTALVAKGPSELLPGERADVSWISEESIDRQGEIVRAAGMDDSHFRLNPIVTMQHAYWMPPVGRSLWRRRVKDGTLSGIKAKTQYPARPASWPADAHWPPDVAFTLVQQGLLRGKSIGLLPTKARRPTDEEVQRDPALAKVRFVIEKWVLLEYACVYLPAQQNAVVEAVSKGLRLPEEFRAAMRLELPSGAGIVPFTPLEELEKALRRAVRALDLSAIISRAVRDGCERARGRV